MLRFFAMLAFSILAWAYASQANAATTFETNKDDRKEAVIYGFRADIKHFPYIAYLSCISDGKERIFCGGAIISENRILTSAYCISFMDSASCDRIQAHFGSFKRNHHNYILVSDYVINPKLVTNDGTNCGDDLAIVKLADDIVYDWSQKAVLLQTQEILKKKAAKFAGWGNKDPSMGIDIDQILHTHTSIGQGVLQQAPMSIHPRYTTDQFYPQYHGGLRARGVSHRERPHPMLSFGDEGFGLTVDGKLVGICSKYPIQYEVNGDLCFASVFNNLPFIQSYI